MRTYDELFSAAMSLRMRLLTERKDPTGSVFTITQYEHCVLRNEPLGSLTMAHSERRFCGFKLHVI